MAQGGEKLARVLAIASGQRRANIFDNHLADLLWSPSLLEQVLRKRRRCGSAHARRGAAGDPHTPTRR
jgi:hypothetical protein